MKTSIITLSEVKECVIEQAKLPTLFSVCKTDYQTLVKEFLCRNRLPSKLRLEIQSTLNIINCAVLPVVLVSTSVQDTNLFMIVSSF